MADTTPSARDAAPVASDAEAASLRGALDRLLDTAPALGDWAHVAVPGEHTRVVASAVWGRWDRVEDDFYDTLARHRGVPVGVDHRAVAPGQADRVELRDVGPDGGDDVVVAVTHWSAGRFVGEAEEAYVQERGAGHDVEAAAERASHLGDHLT